eukprot:6181517-Pleurochrysis_carterae.AAC.1
MHAQRAALESERRCCDSHVRIDGKSASRYRSGTGPASPKALAMSPPSDHPLTYITSHEGRQSGMAQSVASQKGLVNDLGACSRGGHST